MRLINEGRVGFGYTTVHHCMPNTSTEKEAKLGGMGSDMFVDGSTITLTVSAPSTSAPNRAVRHAATTRTIALNAGWRLKTGVDIVGAAEGKRVNSSAR